MSDLSSYFLSEKKESNQRKTDIGVVVSDFRQFLLECLLLIGQGCCSVGNRALWDTRVALIVSCFVSTLTQVNY